MSKKYLTADGIKDENGAFTPLPQPKPLADSKFEDLSIDEELGRGLLAVNRLMTLILQDISMGAPARDTVANLKDCMSILKDLKKSEADILEELDEDQLKKLIQDK